MSTILRWFHDGDIRYHAYFSSIEYSNARRLIVAARDGRALQVGTAARTLEDFSDEELLRYARGLRATRNGIGENQLADVAAD